MDQQLSDPCEQCLVRACCSEPCVILISYITRVLELVIKDPTHKVLEQFSEHQVTQIRAEANRMRENRKGQKDEKSLP